MAEGWNRDRILKELRDGKLPELETGYIDPLLAELRSVARRFELLAEGCRQSNNEELQAMVQSLELSAGMVDDLLDEALETNLRRAVEDSSWANPQ